MTVHQRNDEEELGRITEALFLIQEIKKRRKEKKGRKRKEKKEGDTETEKGQTKTDEQRQRDRQTETELLMTTGSFGLSCQQSSTSIKQLLMYIKENYELLTLIM